MEAHEEVDEEVRWGGFEVCEDWGEDGGGEVVGSED